jgi:hypothetical protein
MITTKLLFIVHLVALLILIITSSCTKQNPERVTTNQPPSPPQPPAPPLNKPPVANAGSDQIITSPQNWGLLDGSLSHDSDGNIVSFNWTKVAGPNSFTIQNNFEYPLRAYTKNTVDLSPGVYEFQLQVKDNGGLISADTLKITVLPDSLTKDPSTYKRFNQLQWDNSCVIRINNSSSAIPAGASIQVYTRSYEDNSSSSFPTGSYSSGWVKVVAVKSSSYWYEFENNVLIIHAPEDIDCTWDWPFHDVLIKWN